MAREKLENKQTALAFWDSFNFANLMFEGYNLIHSGVDVIQMIRGLTGHFSQ